MNTERNKALVDKIISIIKESSPDKHLVDLEYPIKESLGMTSSYNDFDLLDKITNANTVSECLEIDNISSSTTESVQSRKRWAMEKAISLAATEDEFRQIFQRLFSDKWHYAAPCRNTAIRKYAAFTMANDVPLAQTESELITAALKKHKGKRKFAAVELDISERTLYRKIKDLGL